MKTLTLTPALSHPMGEGESSSASPAKWSVAHAQSRTEIIVVPAMIKQHRSAIINVSSREGLEAHAGFAAYSASKSAVLRLTESLAAELKASENRPDHFSRTPLTCDARCLRHENPAGGQIEANTWGRSATDPSRASIGKIIQNLDHG
jgi:NADP-dependent 3-hydroxy acid dehydrogenase YdfG